MITFEELVKRINNDEIPKEKLVKYLDKDKLGIAGVIIFKIIKDDYCNEEIIEKLTILGELLNGYKFIGPWQYGHVAIATLSLLHNKQAREKYIELYKTLSDEDKFWVDSFISSETYKD